LNLIIKLYFGLGYKSLKSIVPHDLLMNKIIFLAAILASAFGLIVSAMGTSLEPANAQTNTTTNASTSGSAVNTTAGNTTDVGTATELEKLTGSNADVMGNNTETASESTGLAGLGKEQTSDTGGNMTEGDKGDFGKGENVQQTK
jgi:hypothetical protein